MSRSAVLTSLRELDERRKTIKEINRPEDSTIDIWKDNDTNEDMLAECRIVGLLDFTQGDFVPYEPTFEVGFAIALAAHQLNVGDGSIVPQVAERAGDNCPVKFTVELLDSQLLEGPALKEAVELISRRDKRPCTVLGAVRSAVSTPTAILTGVQGIPQISGHSTSADLDDKNQYPLFARTIPSDLGNAIPIIRYFREILDVQHLAVLHVNDEYGNFFAEGLRQAAKIYAPDLKIKTVNIPPPQDVTPAAVRDSVKLIVDTGYTYIFSVMFRIEFFDALMEEAYHQGIAGSGLHNWIFSDSFNSALRNRPFPRGSPLHLAYRGVGLMEASSGIPGDALYDRFGDTLRKLKNEHDQTYMSGLLPRHDHPNFADNQTSVIYEESFLNPLKISYISFVYEAAILAGIAACDAVNSHHPEDMLRLTGTEHYQFIKNTTFDAMSGSIVLNNVTGSREADGTLFILTNHVEDVEFSAINKTHVMYTTLVTDRFREGEWSQVQPYTFNDGTNNIPFDLPFLSPQQQFFSTVLRVISYIMCGLILSMAFLCFAWTIRKHSTRVVRASQPLFLHLLVAGVVVLGATIIPNTIDNKIASISGCDVACNIVPWLLSSGFSIVMSALYTKTHRVALIMVQSNLFRRVRVTSTDVMKPMMVYLGINTVILSVMTALFPSKWTIEVEDFDTFGRVLATVGRCTHADGERLYFIIALLCTNFGGLIFTLKEAYATRKLSTEFSESRYIAIAMMTIVVVAIVGGPVLVLANENPDASVFVLDTIIFVACLSILLWIFVPKVCFESVLQSDSEERRRITDIFTSPAGLTVAGDSSLSGDFYGTLVSHKRTIAELEAEIQSLRTLLRHKNTHGDYEDHLIEDSSGSRESTAGNTSAIEQVASIRIAPSLHAAMSE